MDTNMLEKILAWARSETVTVKMLGDLFTEDVFMGAEPSIQNLEERFHVKPAEVLAAVEARAGKDGWPKFPLSESLEQNPVPDGSKTSSKNVIESTSGFINNHLISILVLLAVGFAIFLGAVAWKFVSGFSVVLPVPASEFVQTQETPATATLVEPEVIQQPVEVVEVIEKRKAEDVIVKTFSDLGEFLIDGDPLVKNWKVKGAVMEYTCSTDNGVFISMDPGSVGEHSTGKLGAVAYVVCSKGATVMLHTPHWSDSALHNQIHLVELSDKISDQKLVEILKIFKIDEGKELAIFVNGEEVTKY